jgi:hypothetical protein
MFRTIHPGQVDDGIGTAHTRWQRRGIVVDVKGVNAEPQFVQAEREVRSNEATGTGDENTPLRHPVH